MTETELLKISLAFRGLSDEDEEEVELDADEDLDDDDDLDGDDADVKEVAGDSDKDDLITEE